jgi:pimeloyl-ACP methyl ester carboxylesterase
VAGWLAYDAGVRHLCALRGTPIMNHMTSADTARDMDLVRRALGDEQLNYYGISYGSILGATYAAMFPTRVRTMVLDGTLDPVQWTSGRSGRGPTTVVTARLSSGVGSWEALTSAFAECDRVGVKRCPEAGKITAEWTKVVTTLQAHPVVRAGTRYTYAMVVDEICRGLNSQGLYPSILALVHHLSRAISNPGKRSGASLGRAWAELVLGVKRSGITDPVYGGSPTQEGTTTVSPQFHGVMCSDSVNPTDESAAVRSARFSNRRGLWFGPDWSWRSSVCINWPGSGADAFRGPWHTSTANPILVTGNLHDPTTPISGARAMNRLMKGSVLMTVNLWGHGALSHSACATRRWDAYLVSKALPHDGLVCSPDEPLFPR